ncbi:hypothetical protein SGM_3762 [Streptomyces griseoaurantiacus M045]|uniref:Uncharacterized protein n=1 Tax=Streptomyces griseoaurantiacus M045 TaxID=996637 RepID=F3NKU8_9ACTN|nr:hypothetical protein SGM_3762 [Streptomyces griseoaurantiacus M045]
MRPGGPGHAEGIVPAGQPPAEGCRRGLRTRWEHGGAHAPVTVSERGAPLGTREGARGQDEAPDHGGTTGGFAREGGSAEPHMGNVGRVRRPGQAVRRAGRTRR